MLKSKAKMKTFSLLICILGIKAASTAILPNDVLLEEWEVGVVNLQITIFNIYLK